MFVAASKVQRIVRDSGILWRWRGYCEKMFMLDHLRTDAVTEFFDLFSYIYCKKASLNQRPKSIIVKTGTWARYIAMAAPLGAEWRPTSLAVKPKESEPIEVVAKRRRFNSSAPVKVWIFVVPANWKVIMVVDWVVFLYDQILWTMEAQTFTGHRILSPELCWEMVSFLVSRLWKSKVIDTQSAEDKDEDEWGINKLPLKNRMFFDSRSFVFWTPCTLTFSQDLIAKKNAPINSWQRALSISDNASW